MIDLKTVRNLELLSGAAVMICGLVQVFLFVLYRDSGTPMSAATIILLFIFFVFPALLITSGAYLYSVHRLPLGLGMVVIIGLIYLCFYGYAAFFGSFGLTLWQFVLSMIPSFFVLSTMILALIDNAMTEPYPTR